MTCLTDSCILELKGIKKSYGDVVAVADVSIGIRDGEFLTLLGPSGSGKSTMLLMIAGFEFPTEGEILLNGKQINSVPPNERNVGMVFQNYALFPHMTIFDNIAFPLRMRKRSKEEIGQRVGEVLDLVRLRGYENRYPKQLSGGQQQRIAMARALAFNPPVLLMDEPLGALDRKLREHMQLELKHIQNQLKRTVIYVTHDQEEALVMSDRIAVMNQGKIEQIGTPDELYEEPANKFVAGFIGESNFIEGKVIDKENDTITLRMKDESQHQLRWCSDVMIGEEISFCIRPEKMFVVTGGHPSVNLLQGIISEVIYAGESLRYKIRIGKEKTVYLKEMSVHGRSKAKEGEKVRISWDPENLHKL